MKTQPSPAKDAIVAIAALVVVLLLFGQAAIWLITHCWHSYHP